MNRWWEILVVVVTLTGPITQALAGWQNNATNYYRANNTSVTGITEQKAITVAQHHVKGRVLAINQSDNIYRIKILSYQGTIHTVLVNALDGTIISAH